MIPAELIEWINLGSMAPLGYLLWRISHDAKLNRTRQDERHEENTRKLDGIAADVKRINGTVARHDQDIGWLKAMGGDHHHHGG